LPVPIGFSDFRFIQDNEIFLVIVKSDNSFDDLVSPFKDDISRLVAEMENNQFILNFEAKLLIISAVGLDGLGSAVNILDIFTAVKRFHVVYQGVVHIF